MDPEINCSEFCDSFPGQELDRRPLHDLCKTTITDSQPSSADVSPLSPALLGIVWTFLSCGLLLVLFFLAFTVRCRKNRIVKMSSPNLNIVTLLGSCLTYSSAYLFGIQDAFVGNSMEALIQTRLSMLCIGTSLVFGPILGKSWRLYKVFTQRVPDKRVIIKDLQLLGLVAALVVADAILLVTWVLTDPIRCLQILGVSMKVTGRDVSCSLTNTHFCASRYSDVWIALILGCKGLLLLYGAYLAGLTNHVSSPPVNQSLTIMVGVNLLLLTAGLVFVLTRYLHSWPNLVFGFTSGGIFVCTTTVNCCVFLPQLKQWKTFEGDNQTIRRMAKYFSSPSKSFHSQVDEDQNCHLRDEKSCMERLLTEKNAVIESLQEQVNNAKEKLVKLMSSECTYDSPERAVPAAASAQGLADQGSSEHPAASEDALSAAAAEDSLTASVASQHKQSPGASRRDTGPSPDQKDNVTLKQFCDHADMGCSRKPQAEQCEDPERGDQGPMAPRQSLMADGVGCESHRPKQRNSEELPERLPRVSSVVREKLQEVLQELDLGAEAPLTPLPCSQQLWKSTTSRSPRKLSPSKLGFSPYVVRRRRAAQRARSHFPGSVALNTGHQANRTAVSDAQSGLVVQSRDSPSLDHRNARSKIPRSSSVKPSPLSDLHGRRSALAGSKRCQSEPQGVDKGDVNIPGQPSASAPAQSLTAAPCLPSSPGLPRQRQPRPLVSPGCPSSSSGCYNLDSESSSSDEFFCRCHRPYCEICFQSSLDSSDSDTSDSDLEQAPGLASWEKLWARSKPVVNFKDDLKPTLV
ncbi:probable G-protein coupled receptor 156 isoform X1 [Peromyscus californicus insignis]|uniref:probable G-protein coupled receptor 156 isoform X1 n=1 Tax=Peromyscus californicus insignis TaxID=564181 RepID=UPI0022A724DF|nr:probable G-protein coupled receptor 156 isoform X1 [Peromyscus californicus insignis]